MLEVKNWICLRPDPWQRHSQAGEFQSPERRNRRLCRLDGFWPDGIGFEPVWESGWLPHPGRDGGQRVRCAKFKQPKDAIDAGLAYVTEDRKGDGLILIQDIKQNITLANLKAIARRSVVDSNAEIQVATEYKNSINIKAPSVEQTVGNLSGGNQQKVSVAKWLFVKPDILILDEPTRGIDVGAKYEIYTIMNRLIDQGMSIIMISSELPEILGMSDRVYIVSGGQISGELPIEEATQEKIMQLATN